MSVDYQSIITLEPGKRGGKPCIRDLRITVYDVLTWLADGLTEAEVLDGYPELNAADIRACLAIAADREHNLLAIFEAIYNCKGNRSYEYFIKCPF
ncbi:MAG: DUF433 domain-containing protein [Methylococcales bacterium]